ncbi:MAG: hypothetical protein HYY06_13320 [Deltaproteobacteria bacterium]|nr:hypothetical protein [Deltaproteobacteria bacterium]
MKLPIAFVGVMFAVAACGTRTELPVDGGPERDPGEPSSVEEARTLCADACAHAWGCGWDAPPDCEGLCLDLSRDFRADAFRAVAACITGLDCGANPDDCPDRAAAALDPLPSHEAWSETCLERLPECGLAHDSGACSPRFVVLYTNDLADDLAECLESDCDRIEDCMQRKPLPL